MPPRLYFQRFVLAFFFVAIAILLASNFQFFANRKPSADPVASTPYDAIRQATSFIEIETPDGSTATGTGFIALDRGVVVTNAHVLGLKIEGRPVPTKLRLAFNPGLPSERTVSSPSARIVAVDRENDLAVIRLAAEGDWPEPLPLRDAASLGDLEELIVAGYPGGRRPAERNGRSTAPEVSLIPSRFSALRHDDAGRLRSLQLAGGIVHGNSGAAVVDLQGRVVGIAARVDYDHHGNLTGLAEAVPSEALAELAAGKVASMKFGYPYLAKGSVRHPVTIDCLDPLNAIRSVRLLHFFGETTATFDVDTKIATAEIERPEVKDSRPVFVTAVLTRNDGKEVFGKPISLDDRKPVERVPTPSMLADPTNVSSVLNYEMTVQARPDNVPLKPAAESLTLALKLDEEWTKTREGSPIRRFEGVLTLRSLKLGRKSGLRELVLPESLKTLSTKLPEVNWNVEIPIDGKPAAITIAAGDAKSIGVVLFESIRQVLPPHPCRELKPMESWTIDSSTVLPLSADGAIDRIATHSTPEELPATQSLIGTYVGRRTVPKDEVVIELSGRVNGAGLYGTLAGEFILDLFHRPRSLHLKRCCEIDTSSTRSKTSLIERWTWTKE